MNTRSQEKIYWHDAFYEALQLEFYQYLDVLKFIDEHPLSKEALIIDVLIIKKEPGVKIEKNIGRIFRGINIFEFKSEKDSLSIDDYNKVMGYAYLYAAFSSVHISDITVSFAVTVHPRDLLHYLKNDRGFIITDSDDGIYRIDGDTFPVQILESKKLSTEKNLFLKNLRSNLNHADIQKTFEVYRQLKRFENKNVYIHRLIKANKSTFKEVFSMNDSVFNDPVIREVFVRIYGEEKGWDKELDYLKALSEKGDDRDLHSDPYFVEILTKEDGFIRGLLRTKFESEIKKELELEKAKVIAKNFLRIGRPIEEIAEATGLSYETVRSLE